MDQVTGFFEGLLQPVVRLGLFAISLMAGCWLGTYFRQMDSVPDSLSLGAAITAAFKATVASLPSIQTIAAVIPDLLLKGLMSIWKFPVVLGLAWLLFRMVIVDSGVWQIAGVVLTVE